MGVERTTRTGAIAGLGYLAFVGLTTQVGSVRAALPFTEDPFDAVTSFGVIAIAIVGGATAVRWLAHRRRSADAAVERRIALGAALVTGIAAISVGSDLVAMAVIGVATIDAAVVVAAGLLVLTTAVLARALVAVWQARTGLLLEGPPRTDEEPDLIDDLGAIARSLGAAGMASRLTRWVETSRFSPRRHRLVVGMVGAAAAGLGAVVWHAIREGAWASPAAAAVFGGLMALGVIGAYLVGLEPLRLIRPSEVRTRTN